MLKWPRSASDRTNARKSLCTACGSPIWLQSQGRVVADEVTDVAQRCDEWRRRPKVPRGSERLGGALTVFRVRIVAHQTAGRLDGVRVNPALHADDRGPRGTRLSLLASASITREMARLSPNGDSPKQPLAGRKIDDFEISARPHCLAVSASGIPVSLRRPGRSLLRRTMSSTTSDNR